MNDNTSMTITNDNKNMPQNRAQRRAMAKLQKKQNKMIMNYIKKHPEAVKFELDEDKIAELENEEANLSIELEGKEQDVMTSGYVQVGEPQPIDLSEVETISSNNRGQRIKTNPIDEVCDYDDCGLINSDIIENETETTSSIFAPVKKNNVVKN